MSTRVVTVEMDDRLMVAKDIFEQAPFHHLPVLDEHGHLAGMLSERDLLRAISPHIGAVGETNRDLDTLLKRIHQVMRRNPVTAPPSLSVDSAAKLLLQHNIGSLVVLDGDSLVGIVTWKDLLRHYINP
ncbi:CBS domain-containing protein [Shewanella sedimentimangrovi]|uniref:CBS domain-containing protein n=1 Tax=Shewanella sedimentimangrovi TaxID=2814293 RepID=A0ABX7R573_9GAMM|nr:CBS domain-containing protein [Shewanella sedimentimangrovi]QSX38997.1 CBS domain-containing protein [Shewanella sedimentimangrovi]